MKISNLAYTEVAHDAKCLGGDIRAILADFGLVSINEELEQADNMRVVQVTPTTATSMSTSRYVDYDLDVFNLAGGFDAYEIT